jgi:hypothetical protein
MNRLTGLFSKALQPLVDRAEELDCHERRAWLTDLRRDCPTIARELERRLSPHLQIDWLEDVAPMHALDMLGLRR